MDQANPPATELAAGAATDQGHAPAATVAREPFPDHVVLLQQAFLLEQLAAQGAESKTVGELNHQIGKVARRELQLTPKDADRVRRQLAEQSYLTMRKNGRKVSYELTEAGRAYLAKLERPALSGGTKRPVAVDESAIPEELREAQKAYLLLRLLNADGQALTRGEANKIPKGLQTRLGLKPAVANYRRAKLAELGYIRIIRSGGSETHSLTADGLDYLAAGARHLQHAAFTLKGQTLNALVAAARESSFERDRPTAPTAPERPVPGQAELVEAVLAEFQELRRERHGRSGLVPIHEVRQGIVERFGSAAGRHDMLDEVILGLWRQHRVGLVAISDLGDADEQQLNDSIQGVNGTLFYLEVAREQPAVTEPVLR